MCLLEYGSVVTSVRKCQKCKLIVLNWRNKMCSHVLLCVRGLIYPPPPFLSSQGGNNSTVGKLLHSSAASKLKHLQQNTADNSKSGKKEEFLKMQGEQQVLLSFITVWVSVRWNFLLLLCCQSTVNIYYRLFHMYAISRFELYGNIMWRSMHSCH